MTLSTTMTRVSRTVHPPDAALTVSVCQDFAELDALRTEWDDFVQATQADVYFTLDWCRTWWRFYGRRRGLHVLLFRRNQQLVGLLPLCVERLWLGPIPLRIARLVGADSTIAVLNLPVHAANRVDVCRAAIEYVLGTLHCDALSFKPLSGERDQVADIRIACETSARPVRVLRDSAASTHTIFHLPATFEAYLAALSQNERGNYRKNERRLAQAARVEHRVVTAPDDVERHYEDFMRLHADQWQQQNQLGHFGDWPAAEAFTHELIRTLAPQGRVQLDLLEANGATIALDLSFMFGGTQYWRLPARVTGEEWERCGVGRVAFVRRIEHLIASGIPRMEAGPARYEYKRRLGGVEYPVHALLIVRADRAAVLKTKLLTYYADFLNLLYYRIWFQRIAPRLPLPRRPLWKSWIRSRV